MPKSPVFWAFFMNCFMRFMSSNWSKITISSIFYGVTKRDLYLNWVVFAHCLFINLNWIKIFPNHSLAYYSDCSLDIWKCCQSIFSDLSPSHSNPYDLKREMTVWPENLLMTVSTIPFTILVLKIYFIPSGGYT